LTPRQRRRRQARWGVLIGAAAFLSTAPLHATLALAAGTWTATATGPGLAVSAVVPMGKLPTATVMPTSVKVEWGPSLYATGREVGTYVVRRQAVGSKDAVQVCLVAAPLRACEDSPPAGQAVVYTVVPAEQLWRGPASAPCNPVTLPAPTVIAVAALPSPSPSPSPIPSPSPTPLRLPGPTPSPTPSLTPTPTPAPS
jgi:hypothetical protein